MSIAQEFKELSCISKMKEQYQTKFFRLAEHYGTLLNNGKLNKGDQTNGKLFTLHDFDHHCFNLYHIISNVIFDKSTTYSESGIDPKELYLLNLAVLFHDISMAANIHWIRNVHSKQSSDYVQKEVDNTSSVLCSIGQLSKNEIDTLKLIIAAHSDIKDGSIKEQQQGIKNPNLKDRTEMPFHIREKMLAGILRIADELDLTTDRLGNGEFERQLQNDVEDDGEAESAKHWELLHYFKSIKVNEENRTQIDIVTDDEYLQKKVDQGDLKNIVDNIFDKEKKLNKELSEINSLAFVKAEGFQSVVSARNVIIKIGIAEITEALDGKRASSEMRALTSTLHSPDTDNKNAEMPEEIIKKPADLFPKVLDVDISKTISDYIENQGLFKVGHFRVNDKYCSRDWIDTQEIIETERISNLCVETISDHIKMTLPTYSNCVLLGLDIQGTLLASKIAFKLQLPFSYIIPVQSNEDNSTYDKEIDVNEYNEIIIITDAIATWGTVNEAINQHHLREKVVEIYTVLYRKPNIGQLDNHGLLNKTFSLNCEFGIEVMKKEKCTRTKCLAQNRKVK